MLKKSFSIAISAIVVSFIVGCSNQSPLSVNENDYSPAKEAMFTDVQAQDLGGDGGNWWAVHKTDAVGNDNYLYYFKASTATWIRTSHWGKKVAVTSYGRCYHFNTDNNVWCAKMKLNRDGSYTDSSGFVGSGPSSTIVDIAAATMSPSKDVIYVLCDDNYIYRGYVINNVFQGYDNARILTGYTCTSIAADQSFGNIVIVGVYNNEITGATKFDFPNTAVMEWWMDRPMGLVPPDPNAIVTDVTISRDNIYSIYSGVLYNSTSNTAVANVNPKGLSATYSIYGYIRQDGTPKYENISQ